MTNDSKEALLILQEECAEVTQAISKCFRFGINNYKPGKEKTNLEHLEQEIGDLTAMIDILISQDIGVTQEGINLAKKQKFEKLKHWSNLKI